MNMQCYKLLLGGPFYNIVAAGKNAARSISFLLGYLVTFRSYLAEVTTALHYFVSLLLLLALHLQLRPHPLHAPCDLPQRTGIFSCCCCLLLKNVC